jgi:hypothetical protein
MSAEIITPPPGPRAAAGRGPERVIRPVLGALADGTPFYAPIGAVAVDGSLVTCHLCGRSLRSVAAHLPRHGWTKEQYCAAFGLERGQSLEGPATRKLRAAALSARLIFDPAIRDGSAAGRERARAGELARDAAAAARGRAFPEQRRRKARRPLGEIRRAAAAEAIRDRADRRLAQAAAGAAQRLGYPDIRSLVVARTGAGASLAAISREAGLHKDWLSRHLGQVDPPRRRRRAAGTAPSRLRTAAGGPRPRFPRGGRLPAGTASGAAPHRQRDGNGAGSVPARRRVRAAPARAGARRARGEASSGPAPRRAGGGRAWLSHRGRVRGPAAGRRLDLDGHRRRVGAAADVAAPPGG